MVGIDDLKPYRVKNPNSFIVYIGSHYSVYNLEMANLFLEKGYDVISGGTDNHMILIDLRNKNITGKEAEEILAKADITVNKNMVPFDDKSPFITSGIRIGTAAITTRGLKEGNIEKIVHFIDSVLRNPYDESSVKKVLSEVNQMMTPFPLFA